MKTQRKMSDARLAYLILSGVALFLLGLVIIMSRGAVQFHWGVVLLNVVNIALFLSQLLRAIHRHPYSFDMMHWLFCLFFLGFAPLLQHLTNTYAWELHPKIREVVWANLVVLLWACCYCLGRDYRRIPQLAAAADRVKALLAPGKARLLDLLPDMDAMEAALALRLRKPANSDTGNTLLDRYRSNSLKTKLLDLCLAAAVAAALWDILTVGLLEQISRSTASVSTGNTALDLIMVHGINNLLLFVAVIFILEAKKTRQLSWRLLVALGCLGIACFPTGLNRNMMASFYAGLLIVMFDSTKRGRWFAWVMIAGLVLIFPAMEIFRRISTLQKGDLFALVMDSFGESYVEGHFDAFGMIISIGRYVAEFGISWGKQLLGAALFFVPRSLWPGKPEGTGHTAIVELKQFYFSNVSAPFPAEGYVNFGIFGVILFALLLGMLVAALDRRYWKHRGAGLRLSDMLYPFSMFMFFFLMRGDMMSAWAYTFAQLVVGTVLFRVYRFALRYGGTKADAEHPIAEEF